MGCGVEVGVKAGAFSEPLLDVWEGRHLISVDPWAEAEDRYVNLDNVSQGEHDALHAQTVGRLARFGERSSVWRMTGEQAAQVIRTTRWTSSISTPATTTRRCATTWRCGAEKVRPGGVLAGHDYIDGVYVNGEFGVRSAVDEFFAERSLPVWAMFHDAPWNTWYVLVR